MNLRLIVCFAIFTAILSVLALPQSPAFAAGQPPKKVKIIIEQKYDEESLEILKKEDVAIWFRYAGVAYDDDKNADGTITVTVEGNSSDATYSGTTNLGSSYFGHLHSGAEIDGDITLVDINGTIKSSFSDFIAPPHMITGTNPGIPFEQATLPAFHHEMALLLGRAYGIEPLITALKEKDTYSMIGISAAEDLVVIGDPQAVQPPVVTLINSVFL